MGGKGENLCDFAPGQNKLDQKQLRALIATDNHTMVSLEGLWKDRLAALHFTGVGSNRRYT